MTRKEAMRQTMQADTLRALGFTRDEAEALRRISMTLHRWHEYECGMDHACIVRGRLVGGEFTYDDDGAPYWEFAGASGRGRYQRVPDRETGAKLRLSRIVDRCNRARREATCQQARPCRCTLRARETVCPLHPEGVPVVVLAPQEALSYYIQTDPRGAALYILRPGDVPEGQRPDGYYTRGICIY